MQKAIEPIRKKAPRDWTQQERLLAFMDWKKRTEAEESQRRSPDSPKPESRCLTSKDPGPRRLTPALESTLAE